MDIEAIYLAALRRAPTAAELTCWEQVLAGGGTVDEVRAELTASGEFEVLVRELYWLQFRAQPGLEHLIGARALVAAGRSVELAVLQLGRQEIVSGLVKLA